MIVLRPYEPERDERQVYHLWQRTLSHVWPLPYETFHAVTVDNAAYRPGDHFVAQSDDEIAGFIATQVSERQGHLSLPAHGNLLLILVDPLSQRQGIGRALHDHALTALEQRGVEDVQLGGGATYFWQGVPMNLPGVWRFFQACGWVERERSFDLVAELGGYAAPPEIYERLRRPALTIALATPADGAALLEFEGRHFPGWLPGYRRVVEHNGYGDVVVAKDAREGIVGTSSVLDPRAAWWQHDSRWLHLIGESTGGVGPLGVAEPMRGQGIGLALAARVTELLHERGFAKSYVGWTWLVDWYGKLGYRIWQEYVMSWKKE